ncbi:MAG: 3-dehydroquinate dehydratase [Ignavibacteriaceae bacterium]|nr:3-dehydroquinate dehydratase [Ignavibacteriaceae bacterium]
MKIKVINGANLNLLGKRDSEQYGCITLDQIKNKILSIFKQHEFSFYHSNIEGEIVNEIQNSISRFDVIIINPGGYAHTSVAIKDALELFTGIKIEVHLSHLAKREDFRKVMLTASSCDGYISGFKENGYLAAVYLSEKLSEKVELSTSQ